MRTVNMTLPASELAYRDTGRGNFYVEPGYFNIMAGSSSADIRLTTSLYVSDGSTTQPPTPTPTQTPTPTPTPSTNRGDVNNDNVVNIIDALLVAQFYVGLDPDNFNQDNADTNCDSGITIVDAQLIAQYYVGLISGFC